MCMSVMSLWQYLGPRSLPYCWNPSSIWGVLTGYYQIYCYFLNTEHNFIIFHNIIVVSEGLVVVWDCIVLVLSIRLQMSPEVVCCVCWVFLTVS